MASVVLLGTLDTKGEEYAFLRDRVLDTGCDVVMINAGVLGDPDYRVAFDREAVAREAGAEISALVSAGDRGAAVTAMAEGAAALVLRLCEEGKIHGILGMGGSGSSSIISQAMRGLPIGFPKLLVSTMGAGDVSPFVGTSDIAMMYSVVDIAGINAKLREAAYCCKEETIADVTRVLNDSLTGVRPERYSSKSPLTWISAFAIAAFQATVCAR